MCIKIFLEHPVYMNNNGQGKREVYKRFSLCLVNPIAYLLLPINHISAICYPLPGLQEDERGSFPEVREIYDRSSELWYYSFNLLDS